MVGRGTVLNSLAEEGGSDHYVRPIGFDGLVASYRPKPILETPARHGDVVIIVRYLLQCGFLVRAEGGEKSLTVAEVASMTLALAEDLPEGEAKKQVALLLVAVTVHGFETGSALNCSFL